MTHDLVILGAGPAGMSAAVTADELGLKTLLLDEQPQAGGQIYRNVGTASAAMGRLLGPDYQAGAHLVARLQRSGVEVMHNTLVWDVSRDLQVTAVREGQTFQVHAPQLIAATGAMERPSPVPGWTLPGVMNAGAAQIALKSGGFVPAGRVALAGAGPLLLLVACQLVQAGVDVVALVDTTLARQRRAALKHLPAALRAPEYLYKGAKMLARLRRAGTARFRNASDLTILGGDRAEGLRFTARGSPTP
ncbi:FAD-dependent oxidoreductase [Achromobacter xylosoxidans]